MKNKPILNQIRSFLYDHRRLYKMYKISNYLLKYSYKSHLSNGNDIMVCGASRSGSTLMYNIIKGVLQHKLDRPYIYLADEKAYAQNLSKRDYFNVKKTHAYSYLLEKRIRNKQTLAYFTHRNLLDIISSSIQKGWYKDVDEVLERKLIEQIVIAAMFFIEIPGIKIISYEQLMQDKPKVIRQVSDDLSFNIKEEFLQNLANNLSVKNVKKHLGYAFFEISGKNAVDTSTGFHSNHINNPELDKWKEVLSPKDLEKIKENKYYELYNTALGYPS